MKAALIVISFMLCFHLPGRSQDFATIKLKDSARIFGKGSISDGDFIFNAAFTTDGNTCFFTKATINWNYLAIFYSTRKNGEWAIPQPVPFTGVYRDTDPFVRADGKRLYFASDRPDKGETFKDYNYRLFYVDLDHGLPSGTPVKIDLPLPKGMQMGYPSFADNGDLYFSGSNTATDWDIYMCAWDNGVYKAPVKLSFNDDHLWDIDPMVAKDESFIIFSSAARKGVGDMDLWISYKKGNEWSAPVNMGSKINSPDREAAPGLSPDNKTLYFSANHEIVNQRPAYKNGQPSAAAVNKVIHSSGNGLSQLYEINIADLPGQGN